MTDEKTDDGLVEGYLREHLKEKRRDGDPAPHPMLAEIDDAHARSVVSLLFDVFGADETLPEFEDTPLAKSIANYSGGESLHTAVEDGNIAKTGFMKGVDGGREAYYNVTHYVESEWESRIDENGVQKSLVNGDEGSGKSNWMLEEGFVIAPRVIKRETDKKVLGASNVSVEVETTELDRYEKIEKTSELDALIEEYGEMDGWEVITALDEGDQLFGGAGKGTHRANELGDRIKLMRHSHFHILMTSQRQVAPEIRNRFDVRHKPDDTKQHKMVFAKSTDKEGNPEEVVFRSNNIPETQVEYTGAGTWEHDVGGDDDDTDERVREAQQEAEEKERELNIRLKRLYENTDMSYAEVGNAVGLTKDKVYRRVKKAKNY